ncbi:MAG: NIP7 N-terminal domain-related protein [Candidatus Thorarchaeota archaeon]
MSERIRFRKINDIEKQIIAASISNISTELPQIIENLTNFLYVSLESSITKAKSPSIFIISKDQDRLLRSLDSDKIISAGLYFGFIKKGKFYLSLEGAEFLEKNHTISDIKRLQVNVAGEKSILYGKNILKNMITKIPPNLENDDFLLIFNSLNELIAVGRSYVDKDSFHNLKPSETVAFNLTDKGYYLRKIQ